MEKAKITFLGTGSAIPTKHRNHPAVLLQYKDENILVDCGEGTQRQFRKAKLNPCKITRILITHWHGDHVLGLPGLLQTLMLNGYNKTLEIYGPSGTKKMMQLYLGLFTHKDKITIKVNEVENKEIIDTNEFYIETKKMEHETPSNAYAFVIKEKLRINKKKIEKLNIPREELRKISELQKGKDITIENKKIKAKDYTLKEEQRKVTFILDTKKNKNAITLAKNSDILICESTYSEEEEELAEQHFHLTSTDAAQIAKQAKVKRLILTHLSQRYDYNNKEILQQAKKVFPKTEIVEDLDVIEF
jgi:ribonuclease Z